MRRCPLFCLSSLWLFALAACSGGGGNGGTATGTVSISGRILAPAYIAVDTDSNDPQSPYAANNSLATAQVIANPVMAEGFVAATPTGIQGSRFASSADSDDFYAVDLAAGQAVVLEVADPALADIDLALYDAGGALIDASVGVSRFENVVAAAGGRYFVRVNAYAGHSNYVLMVGTGTTPAASLNLAAEFVPGEAIVHFGAVAGQIGATAAKLGLNIKAGDGDRPQLVSLAGVQAAGAFTTAPAPLADTRLTAVQAAKLDTLYQVKALRARTDVKSADPNYRVMPLKTPNDPYYRLQWHYPLINLPQAWDITTGTPASGMVVVAVVDTGVFLAHADLSASLLRDGGGNVVGYDFVSNTASANDGDGIDANPDDPGDESTPGSSSWHGTHVAGTIAAASDNGVGVAGVAAGARIMPVRVLGKGGGTTYDVIQGIRYAAGLSNDSGRLPARRADIINMSLGCQNCYVAAQQTLLNEVRNAGVIVIAAAGNENSGQPGYPAAYDGVVSVSAVGLNRDRTPYSNFGATVDVAAPGGDTTLDLNGDGYGDGVLSTLVGAGLTSDYKFYQGTSMAAPHMSGVVALMKAVHPGLTPGDLDALLASGAITTDLGAVGRDDLFGWGLIDAAKAVVEARRLASGTAVATLAADPGRLDFGSTLITSTLTLAKLGSGPLAVTTVSGNAAWLSVAAASLDADHLGSYRVSVNRAGLPAGTYAATLTVASNAGSQIIIPISMTVATGVARANTGQYWILLMDSDYNLVQQVNLAGNSGHYDFQFNDLPKGFYYLFAGTDSDWDDLICDDGEVCGAYPTLGEPLLIDASSDRSGIDFSVGFSSSPSALASSPAEGAPGYRHTGGAFRKGVARVKD